MWLIPDDKGWIQDFPVNASTLAANVAPMAIGGKLHVVITHEVSPWQTNEQVDGWNKQLLNYFKHRSPEYSDTFAGLIGSACPASG